MSTDSSFPAPLDKAQQDETNVFSPNFKDGGLISAIVSNASDNQVLMLGYMNVEALRLTLETGHVHFYSRSRQRLWKKGETSGEIFQVKEILTDCDQDALVVKVEMLGRGAACHTARKSCFYRAINLEADNGSPTGSPMQSIDDALLFDPEETYKG